MAPSKAGGSCCTCSGVKKWTTRVTMACFFLAGGIEYSVIFPTMWDYLHGLGGQEWLYGLSLAAFSISNLFAGPVYGFVFDMTHRTKLIVLFANLFEIGGNFMYFSATSKYMILGSRFIVGMGAGAGAAIFGDLARISTKKERTVIFSVFTTMRQVGLILGPAFNLALRLLDVKFGPFTLDKYTAPGAFMTVMWIVLELMFLLMFYHLPSAAENEEEDVGNDSASKYSSSEAKTEEGLRTKEESDSSTCSEKCSSMSDSEEEVKVDIVEGRNCIRNNVRHPQVHMSADDNHSAPVHSESNERTPLLSSRSATNKYSVNKDVSVSGSASVVKGVEKPGRVSERSPICSRLQKGQQYVFLVASEMVKEEIVVLLAILFMTMFSQTAIETMLVPVAEDLLGWTERDTSIFYSGAGVEIIVSVAVVMVLSKWVGDRWQIMIGLVLELFGYSWMTAFVGPGNRSRDALWQFIVGSVPILFGLPFFVITGASLYSKFLPMKVQGIGQGIRRSLFSIAAILGPLWAGGAVAIGTYYVLLGVPLGLLLLVTILVVLSFSRLKEPRQSSLFLS